MAVAVWMWLMMAGTALAQETPAPVPVPVPVPAPAPVAERPSAAEVFADEAVEEVIVYGDLFARWDGTRWMITSEMSVPYALPMLADENMGFRTNAFQLRAVLGCEKDWKLGKRKFEVLCEIEDFGMQASVQRGERGTKPLDNAQRTLDQIDAKLTGAKLQLQVLDDGRVAQTQIEGLERSNRREGLQQEMLRQVLDRLMSGFHLKLRKFNQLNEGEWLEYNSNLMSMPSPSNITPAGTNMVKHYLNRFDGHTLVQSIGRGMVSVPMTTMTSTSGPDYTKTYKLDLIGVSIFDIDEGYMTERVWAIEGLITAGAFFDDGGFWYAGRMELLEEDERPDVGPTRVINARGEEDPKLPAWVPIER
ncbi:MAG: hypothetical protein ACI8PZ_004226 [Myxococcota bacterium]|jgi:hypothetical protein